jgi:thiamine biosynthesis lipoprotein
VSRRPAAAGGLSRRQFLTRLGLLAGAGAAVPLLGRWGLEREPSLEVRRPRLGTWIRIVVHDPDRARAERAVDRAFAAIDRVDAQMSLHRADSQLNRVNRAAGHAPAPVDPAVLEVVERACATAARSDGLYDPTVLPLMRLYGFYRDGAGRFPSDREIAGALAVTGWRQVRCDRTGGTLGLERSGAALDLGSIGKGWAVDQAVAAMRAEGVRSGLVDAGGNVYGLGVPEDGAQGWSVGVFHPVSGRLDRVFVLRDAAVATSGNTEQFRVLSGVRVGHLFDARRGRPAAGHLSASVQAPTGVESDAMSTAAFLLGPSGFRAGSPEWPRAETVHFIG